MIYRGHESGNGPNIIGSGFHFDIITGDGADLVLNFAGAAGAGLKQWTRAGLRPRLLEINKILESRVGWAAFGRVGWVRTRKHL